MAKALKNPEGVYKNDEGRWSRYCPVCEKEITHLRRSYCIGAHNIQQACIQCSNKNNHPSGMVGSIRLSWYESFRKSALTRGYSWEVTPEYIDSLYNQQKGRCAFTDLPISCSVSGWDHSMSIDRIDNDVGYTEDNIHLVHKRVNMMRGSMSVDEFIEFCYFVSQKHTKGI